MVLESGPREDLTEMGPQEGTVRVLAPWALPVQTACSSLPLQEACSLLLFPGMLRWMLPEVGALPAARRWSASAVLWGQQTAERAGILV